VASRMLRMLLKPRFKEEEMILYVCNCGDQLAMTENTEQSRVAKKKWKLDHSAPLFQKSPKRKVPEKGRAGIHGYVHRVVKSH